MSEEFESERHTEDGGINPIGKYLIYAVVLIVVIATVYGIFHTGIDLGVNRESAANNNDGIDLAKLRDEARVKPSPAAPIQRTAVSLLEPQQQILASPTPAPQRAPDAMEQWRMQEALKAPAKQVRSLPHSSLSKTTRKKSRVSRVRASFKRQHHNGPSMREPSFRRCSFLALTLTIRATSSLRSNDRSTTPPPAAIR